MSSVRPIASEKYPSDNHGRAPPKMKSAPRSETSLMLIDIRTTVATKPLSTVHELSTFSSFRKSISILVADLTETSSRLIIIPKRNKIEKDLYRTVVSPPKIARTMPIVSCYACSAVWYTPEFLLRRIFPMSRFLPCLAGSRDRIFVGPVGTILYSTVLYYSLGELLDENPRGVICPGGGVS